MRFADAAPGWNQANHFFMEVSSKTVIPFPEFGQQITLLQIFL